ncbi:hypothetical protein BBJ28_00008827 [Nothophytophthora sp. Chile5]|nr:hypothetical protein BBJ28_00008827 [Nothophytophthora sp. Chile5]
MPARSSRSRGQRSPSASESSSEASTSGREATGMAPSKKRKPTYVIRKETQTLQSEIRQLESQVAVLQTRGLPSGASEAADPALLRAKAEAKVLASVGRGQQLGVAAAQSLMTRCLLRNAFEYIMARSRHLTESQMQQSRENFETEDGDFCSLGSSVVHFPGVRSLQQVFDAVCFYLSNMEISISERLGNITVREDYDVIEGSAYNARITSSDASGLTTETNVIGFTQLFGEDDPRFGGEPCAIVASDCVDEDELYPYRPSEHVRKDISGAVVLTASRRKKQHTEKGRAVNTDSKGGSDGGEDDDELVVTMQRAGFLKLHCPQFPVSPFASQELEAGISLWGDVMFKTVRGIVYGEPY